jgi:hypothetical protein
MPPTIPPSRLHILAARTKPLAVILRRGPSEWFHVLRYRTDTDELEPGAWFRGHIYRFRCDLSDDGRYMVVFAMGPRARTWSAVCEPPSLTPLAEWSTYLSTSYYGGGIWLSDRTVAVNIGKNAKSGAGQPFNPDVLAPSEDHDLQFVIHDSSALNPRGNIWGESEGVLYPRLQRDGWTRQGPFGEDRKSEGKDYEVRHEGDSGWSTGPTPQRPMLRMYYRGYLAKKGRSFEFHMPDHPAVLTPEVEWATWDRADNLLVARKGCVERWRPEDFAAGTPSNTLDLNGLRPPDRSSV